MPYKWALRLVGITFYAAYYWLVPKTLVLRRSCPTQLIMDLQPIIVANLNTYISVFIYLVLLLIGHRIFNHQCAADGYVADSSFFWDLHNLFTGSVAYKVLFIRYRFSINS